MTIRFLTAVMFALVNCPIVYGGELSARPNIVYILADDLGYAELGCYGQEKIQTPYIDQLAAEGMRFTQHYSGNAVCAPSRCSSACPTSQKSSGSA